VSSEATDKSNPSKRHFFSEMNKNIVLRRTLRISQFYVSVHILPNTCTKYSYVAIDIVRESVLIKKCTQQVTMSRADVLSIRIGFLLLVEVVELLYRLIRHQYPLCSRTHAKQTVSSRLND